MTAVKTIFRPAVIALLIFIFCGCGGNTENQATTTTLETTTSSSSTTTFASTTTSNSTTTTTSSTTTTTMGSGPAAFSSALMAVGNISEIYPLGNMNPPDHTLPTDHIYFLFKNISEVYDVFAPVSGKVVKVGGGGGSDYDIEVKCSETFKYYIGHLGSLESFFVPYIGNNNVTGLSLATGQKVGTAGLGSQAVALDLGVIDEDVTRSFINSGNYSEKTINCGAPLNYYLEPYKTSYEALVTRVGTTEKNGKIDYDQAGKLIGNWFAIDLDAGSSHKGNSGPFGKKHIAFAPNNLNAAQEMISIGGEITGEGVSLGVYPVQNGATPFANVNQSSGIVSYTIYNRFDLSEIKGYLIVRYNANDTISVEASSSNLTNFSSAVKTYTR